MLADKVKKGGSGTWARCRCRRTRNGRMPDIKTMVTYVLALK